MQFSIILYLHALMMKKLRHKYYNKRIITRDNGNVQSQDQEGSKLNSTINASNCADTLTHVKNNNQNNVATVRSK